MTGGGSVFRFEVPEHSDLRGHILEDGLDDQVGAFLRVGIGKRHVVGNRAGQIDMGIDGGNLHAATGEQGGDATAKDPVSDDENTGNLILFGFGH